MEAQYNISCYHNCARSDVSLQDPKRNPKIFLEESQHNSEQTQIDEISTFQAWSDFIEKIFIKSRKTTTDSHLILELEYLLVANNADYGMQNAKSLKRKREGDE